MHSAFAFGRNFSNDVALLRLERAVPFPAVQLSGSPDDLQPGERFCCPAPGDCGQRPAKCIATFLSL